MKSVSIYWPQYQHSLCSSAQTFHYPELGSNALKPRCLWMISFEIELPNSYSPCSLILIDYTIFLSFNPSRISFQLYSFSSLGFYWTVDGALSIFMKISAFSSILSYKNSSWNYLFIGGTVTSGGFINPFMRLPIQSTTYGVIASLPPRCRLCNACALFRKETKYFIAGSIRPMLLKSKCTRKVLYFMKWAKQSSSSVFLSLRGTSSYPSSICHSVRWVGWSSMMWFQLMFRFCKKRFILMISIN